MSAQNAQKPVADEARGEIPTPEAAVIPLEAVMPPPHAELPKPPLAVVPVSVNAVAVPGQSDSLVILPAVYNDAQRNMMNFIKANVSPELKDELRLRFVTKADNGKTDLSFVLHGNVVDANAALLEAQVLNALESVPAIKPYFTTEHAPHASNDHDFQNEMHITLPNLNIAQYAQLVQSLAQGIPHVTTPANDASSIVAEGAVPDHQCSGAGCSQCHAQGAEATTDAAPSAATPAVEAAAHPVAQAAAITPANDGASASLPSTVVEAPAVAVPAIPTIAANENAVVPSAAVAR